MKRIFICMSACILAITSFAQKQTFDLTTFTPPKSWTKEVKANSHTSYSIINNEKKTYCQIFVMLSTASKGGIKEDFESEWETLVAKQYGVTDTARLTEPTSENGWQVLGGVGFFTSNNGTSTALLTTMSGYNKAVSIVAVTNSEDYIPAIQKFIESVEMKKPETASQNLQQQPTGNQNNAPALLQYNWKQTSNHKDAMGNYAGYSSNTYAFSNNNTYKFSRTDFQNYTPKFYLEDEEGTYKINGNSITLTPAKSSYHTHMQKKDDPILKSGKLSLTVIQYRFEFINLNNELTLLLTPVDGNETKRDGSFSYWMNGAQTKSYSYASITKENTTQNSSGNQQENREQSTIQPSTPATSSGFKFTTTTYSDGWVATEQADWVEVTKGTNKVLIHYPNKEADEYNSVLMNGLKNAWNILVAPKYSSASNFEFKETGGWEAIEFAEADMTEISTGKTVHVVLFRKHYSSAKGKYVEFITPDKQSFEKEFGVYQQNMTGAGFEKIENMAFLNKFAVAASDLTGKWSNKYSNTIQYVSVYTGRDAGMDTHASAENYQFGSGNTYKWDLVVANGPVGNIKFQTVKSSGKLTMDGNWKINLSDIEGKPRNYDVYFSCIKGLRILWINNEAFGKVE